MLVVNAADAAIGASLLAYAGYALYVLRGRPGELMWPLAALCGVGILVFAASVAALLGTWSDARRGWLKWTACAFVLAGALELAAAVFLLIRHDGVVGALDREREASRLSERQADALEGGYDVIAWALLGASFLELLRWQASRSLGATQREDAALRASLLQEDDREEEERQRDAQGAISEKYSRLRAFYRSKYSRESA